MLLQVDGWVGSGKNVLMSLLEGHPDLYCNPVHDISHYAYNSESDWQQSVKSTYTKTIGIEPPCNHFYQYGQSGREEVLCFNFAAGQVLKLPTNGYHNKWNQTILTDQPGGDRCKAMHITSTCCRNLFHELNPKQPLPKYYATLTNGMYIDYYKNLPLNMPSSKTVHVRRDLAHTIATLCNRIVGDEDLKNGRIFTEAFINCIDNGEIEQILHYFEKMDRLQRRFPQHFMKVNFCELVNTPELVMPAVAEFLGIEYTESMLVGSVQGKASERNGPKYTTREPDYLDELLSVEEQRIVKARTRNYYEQRYLAR